MDDKIKKKLKRMTKDELIDLIRTFNFCPNHLGKKLDGGIYGNCLHCGLLEQSNALSEIDIEILNPEPDEYGNRAGLFDIDCDPPGVVRRFRKLLEELRQKSHT